MTVAITQDTETHVSINALFVQPTSLCTLNCSGCYVKQGYVHHSKANKLDTAVIADLIHNVNVSDINANQITFALDFIDYEKDPDDTYYVMKEFDAIWDSISERKAGPWYQSAPEFHATIFSLRQMILYSAVKIGIPPKGDDYPVEDVVSIFSAFDLVSVSVLTEKDIEALKGLKRSRLKINWNYQPTGASVEDQFRKIEAILPHVESMYLIIHKPDLGIDLDKKSISNYFELWNHLKQNLSPELLKKIEIDGCVKDAKKFVDTGYGCSSSVSRFQVWPGGQVTGCPYKHAPTTGPADTLADVVKNIRKAKQTYEFNKCKIPSNLHPSHPRIEEKEHPYLRILND